MAFGIIHHFPGGTKENYEASIAAVHPASGLPDGQVFHAAARRPAGGPSGRSTSPSRAGRSSHDEILVPRMQAGIAGGFPTPPQETEIDLSTVMP